MLHFANPEVKSSISEDGRTGRIEIFPLSRGYGITLGNALRRVLLNSIPGVAPTQIMLNGDNGLVLHEFSSLPGVKEDVCDIVLNVKGILVVLNKMSTYKSVIDVVGPCVVTDKDLSTDGNLIVINPDHHIATVEDGHRFYMEITFSEGEGYVSSAENRAQCVDAPLGTIFVDSIYTPVRQVGYSVENMRHEDRDGFERLILDVTTNGIQPVNKALALAGSILSKMFSAVATLCDGCFDDITLIPNAGNQKLAILSTTIEELDLTVRSFNCLKRANINTVQELISKTEDDIFKLRNFGKKSYEEIKAKLQSMGLDFAKQ